MLIAATNSNKTLMGKKRFVEEKRFVFIFLLLI
jgi:hypothetical protein